MSNAPSAFMLCNSVRSRSNYRRELRICRAWYVKRKLFFWKLITVHACILLIRSRRIRKKLPRKSTTIIRDPPRSLHSRFRYEEGALSTSFRNPFSKPGEPGEPGEPRDWPAKRIHAHMFPRAFTLRVARAICIYVYVCIRGQTRFSCVRLLSLVCVRNVRWRNRICVFG